MPFACRYHVPGDEQIYAKVKAEIGEDKPEGLIAQLVSKKQGGGLHHIAVWETKEQFERFQADKVGPAVGRVLAGMGIEGTAPRPEITEMDIVDVITAD